MSTTWIVVIVAVLAALAYYFLVHKKKHGIPVMAKKAAGPSKKSRWRRALGSATKMASVAGIPGAAQFGAIAGAGGIV